MTTAPATGLRQAPPSGGLARNGAISFVGAVGAAVLGFLLTVVVGRTLGASGSGLFFTVAAVFFILSNAMELGADTALVWALPRLRALGRTAELRSTVRIALLPVWVASAAAALALFVVAPRLAEVLVEPAQQELATELLRLVAPFLLVGSALAVALAGTRGLGSVVPFTLVGNIGLPLSRPLLVVAVTAAGLGTAAVVVAWSVPLVVATLVAFAVLFRLLRAHEQALDPDSTPARPWREQVREFWRYATPRCFSAILEIALVWTDVLLVAALSTTRQAGIYAAASRFITTGTLVEAALRVALGPRLSEQLALGDRLGAERLTATASVCIVALSWPIYLTLAVFAPVLLQLFGDDFVAGSSALAVLALSMALAMAAGLAQTVLLMSGNSGWQLANKVVALSLNVVLNLLLVPRFGIPGAAVAWSVAILVDALAAVVQVRFIVGLRFPVRRVLPVAVLSLLCFGVGGVAVRAWLGTSLGTLALYLLLAGAAQLIGLWAMRRHLELDTVLAGMARRPSNRPTS